MLRYAAIAGSGMYVPEQVVTNDDLSKIVDTNDEWIRSRTGIAERRIADSTETSVSMAVAAAKIACERAGTNPADLDLVIIATYTPDQYMPSVASLVQNELGARHAGAFDLNAACSGFVYALSVGTQFVRTGAAQKVLVVGTDYVSRFLDFNDRRTCVLFGDGAGAVVLEASDEPAGLLSVELGSDGSLGRHLTLGSPHRYVGLNGARTVDRAFMQMNGQEVYRFAVRVMGEAAASAVHQAGLTYDDIDLFIPHQANRRIIDAAAKRLELPPEKVWINVDRYGNTSNASVPICLVEAEEAGVLQQGMNVALVGFGGGLTWAAGVVRWTRECLHG
ncbi:MAG: beta-ketoacyl-ACP synthase III [Thermomicrobiales bacterium]